jgi:hypothetical protein
VTAVPVVVGRRGELYEIEARLSLAQRGVGALILVAGEAGVGKTALAEQAALHAKERGFEVAWAACWQTAVVSPLQPWMRLLSQLEHAGEVPPDLSVATGDHDSARVEQADRVVRWLRRRAETRLMFVIEDLHWADAATLSVLGHVASVIASMPVVVVATSRPVNETAGDLAQGIAVLRRHGTVLELAGFDVDATAELLAAVRGGPVSAAATRSVLHLTGGNPLFIRELSRALPAAFFRQGGDVAGLVVPATLRALVTDRRSSLTAGCRNVLDALSVAGDETDVGLLATVCDATAEAVLEFADEASRAGLVDVGPHAISFRHALFRAAVYDSLPTAGKARLHDRVGRELEARRGRGLPVDTSALAHHFGRAATLGNSGRAFSYALEAAEEASALLSFDVVVRRLRQALAMLAIDPTLGDGLELSLRLADALAACGDLTGARKVFRDVADQAAVEGAELALGRAALGFSGGLGGIEVTISDPEVCDLLERAAVSLRDDHVLGARVEARLATALSYRAPLAERTELAARARRRATVGGDPMAVAESLAAWCDVVAGPDHLAERRGAAAEIIERAGQAGDARLEALGRRLLVEALFEAGELRRGELEVARFERTAARLGRAEYAWYAPLWRAALAFARGHMEARARARADLDVLVGEAGGGNAALLARVQRGTMAFDLGDPVIVQDALGEMLELGAVSAVDDVQLLVTRTLVGALAGDLDGARSALDRCVAAVLAADHDSEWPSTMMQVAEVIVALGGHPAAAAVREAVGPYGHVWVVEGIGAAIRGPLDRVLGSLAAIDGDVDAAVSHFAAARESAIRAGAVLLAAVVDHEAGLALNDRPSLERAAEVWRRVGATCRLTQIEAALGPAAQPVAGAPSVNRFVRDGDVWTITFAGSSCSLPDRKGLRDLARLVAEPGRAIAAQDLMTGGATVVDGGTGPAVDVQARDEYRRRLVEIEAELDEADGVGDRERSERLVTEQEALIAELRGAFGLGGRPRLGGVPAERARTAVRSRISDALQRIETAHPMLGRHLRRSVRTGTYCVYQPDPAIDWTTGDSSHSQRPDLESVR